MKFSLNEVKHKGDKAGATPFEFFVWEPLSLPVVWFLANFTSLTPNMITGLSVVFILGASYALVHKMFAIGMFLLIIGFVLDWCDGRLARLKGMGSPLGAFLDHLTDTIRLVVITPSYIYIVYNSTGDLAVILWGMSYVVILQLLMVFYARSKQLNEGKLLAKVLEERQQKNKASPSALMRLRTWFKNHRLLLSFSAVDTDGIALVGFPLIAFATANMSLITTGLMIGASLLGGLYVVLNIIQLKVSLSKNGQ